MALIFSGIVIPVSTIDWYGRSASVIFFNGCNFKCLYCSNVEFIRRASSLQPFFREKRKKAKNKCLFSWNDIPGIDTEKLIEFLRQNYDIDWAKTAKIDKINDGRTINLSAEKHFLSLKLNNEKTKVNLKIDENPIREFIAKTENDKLKIYKITKVILKTDDGRVEKLKFKIKDGELKIYDRLKLVSNPLEPTYMKENIVNIEEIEKQIFNAKSFISAVVFSGGEPTTHPQELEHLAKFAKGQGLLVGIETNGYNPDCLVGLIEKKLVDKIFLDIKAAPDDAERYGIITGRRDIRDAAEHVLQSLALRDVDIEVRTTVFRSFADVVRIAKFLAERDITYVIQQGIPEYAPNETIRKDKPFTRDELVDFAKRISFLKDVRIRTREKGEERII